jgi:hypothetical protein
MPNNVVAIKKDNIIISVWCGRNCFSVEDGKLVFDEHVFEFKKRIGGLVFKEYNDAFDLCVFAFENNLFDDEINQ